MPRRHPRDPGPSKAIGLRLAEARRAAGLTQRELAEALDLAPRSVQAWEEGKASPFRRLDQLETLLRCPGAWILHGNQPAHESAGSGAHGVSQPSEISRDLEAKLGRIERRLDRIEERMLQLDIAVGGLRRPAQEPPD